MQAKDRLVESWDGRDYTRHSAHQREWGAEVIRDLSLQGDERILDLGCGDGSLTRMLADRVPRGSVLGVDAAPGMLEAARERCGPNMEVRRLDIEDLAFEAEFDRIFSNATLHWVHDHAALLRQVHRALRPAGIFRAEFAGGDNCPHLVACLRTRMATPPFSNAFAGFRWPWFFPSLPEYEALLGASPFQAWRAWTGHREQRFPTSDALVGWLDNPCLIPFVQALPSDLRRPFRDGIVDAVLAATRQADGTYLEPFERVNVLAHKAGAAR